MAIILFVGSNPSNASTTETAFHQSTKSGRILRSWIESIDGQKEYVNVVNQRTDDNRPLTMAEIKANLPRLREDLVQADKIVALGKTAAKALSMLGVYFYEMPHPSGRNRLLNDPKFVEEKIKGLQEHCNPSTSLIKV